MVHAGAEHGSVFVIVYKRLCKSSLDVIKNMQTCVRYVLHGLGTVEKFCMSVLIQNIVAMKFVFHHINDTTSKSPLERKIHSLCLSLICHDTFTNCII